MVVEDVKKKQYVDYAKTAGLTEEELKPMADMIWNIKHTDSMEEQKSIMVKIFFRRNI